MAANPEPNTITIRDFLTDKHGFTLPAARLTSYAATLKHTSASLFRHPKAFTVHFHASVNENNCDTPLEKDRWERGEYFPEGKVTLWAHFVRIPGVDIFGEPLGEVEERRKEVEWSRRRARQRPRHALEQEMVRRRFERALDEPRGRRGKKAKAIEGHELLPPDPSMAEDLLKHGRGAALARQKNAMHLLGKKVNESHERHIGKPGMFEGHKLPPPYPSPPPLFSKPKKNVTLPKENMRKATAPAKAAPLFARPQDPVALSVYKATALTAQKDASTQQRQRHLSESPLFEPGLWIKQELPEYSSDDEGMIEWDDGCCC